MNKNKIILFHPDYFSSGLQVAGAYPGVSGHKVGTILNSTPFHDRKHTHPHLQSAWDNLDTPVQLTCTSLGYGG